MLRSLALSLFFTASALAGPIRVLYVDPKGEEQRQTGPLAEAMQALGREAIWFDYLPGVAQPDADFLKNFDLVRTRGQALDRESILGALSAERRAVWEKFLAAREREVREKNQYVANYEKRPEALTFQKPFSPKGAMERTQVPADCRLELFASEPDIGKPIAFVWDERGRLWLAETSDYPHGVVASGEGNDRVKICEDTDGDGRADKFTVFADKLNIPTGLVLVNGGVVVSQPPRFVFLRDKNGDDRADERKVIVDAWGIGDTHAQASNLHYGYDNWLYGCVGYSGFKGTIGGKEMDFRMGTYRFKADGSAMEFLHQFSNNAWAHSTNDAGDQFGGTANGAPIFFGGIPKSVVPAGVNVMTAKKINVVEQAHTITPNFRQVDVIGGYTSAAGSAFIASANLPARFQGKAMVCEPTMKIVALMDVRPDGAGYTALDAMNLFASSDEWTSPVYAEVGPDGAVWIADWQNFIIQHNPTPSVVRGGFEGKTGVGGAHENPLRDHERGRIYRVVWKNAKPTQKSLVGAKTDALVAALNDDTQYWRLMAQRLLVESKKTDATDALKKLVLANDGAVGAIHALWALKGLGALDEATHQAALLAKDARLRRNAVRALDATAQGLFFGAGVFADRDPATRLAAFVKLAEFPTTPEIKTLVLKLSIEPAIRKDEWLAEAAKLLAKKHGADAFTEGPNLLTNAGLEELDANGQPTGWKRRDYGSKPGNPGAEWKIVNDAHSGKNALRCITRDAGDTSFFQEVAIKPRTLYRLSGWVKTHALNGKVSFNDHLGRAETEKFTVRHSGSWVEVETTFDSKERTRASINILHVAKGDGYFDDVKLCELLPVEAAAEKALAGDAMRGEKIFWEHPVAACKICHMLKGQGSTVGPALDGIAGKKDEAYLIQSLLEPNAKLAEGFEKLGASPMPPLGLILKPQEMADVQAFVLTLK